VDGRFHVVLVAQRLLYLNMPWTGRIPALVYLCSAPAHRWKKQSKGHFPLMHTGEEPIRDRKQPCGQSVMEALEN
jgi:hypothetical protein